MGARSLARKMTRRNRYKPWAMAVCVECSPKRGGEPTKHVPIDVGAHRPMARCTECGLQTPQRHVPPQAPDHKPVVVTLEMQRASRAAAEAQAAAISANEVRVATEDELRDYVMRAGNHVAPDGEELVVRPDDAMLVIDRELLKSALSPRLREMSERAPADVERFRGTVQGFRDLLADDPTTTPDNEGGPVDNDTNEKDQAEKPVETETTKTTTEHTETSPADPPAAG